MVIEKLHGLQATSMSLNDRFTLLAATAPVKYVPKPRRRASGVFRQGQFNNRALITQMAQHFGHNDIKQAVRQRIGMPGLRRFGSEGSLVGLRRSNSFSNLSQNSVKNRVSWRQSNGNLSRSASFNNLSRGRVFRRRAGRMGLVRGKMRGRGGRQQVVGRLRVQQRVQRGAGARGAAARRGGRARAAGTGARGVGTSARGAGTGVRGRGRGTARGRGRGRGGATTQQKPVPSKEELDLQLDQYMANCKSHLDKELDEYMKNAMDLE